MQVTLAEVNASKTSDNLSNETIKIVYSLYWAKTY